MSEAVGAASTPRAGFVSVGYLGIMASLYGHEEKSTRWAAVDLNIKSARRHRLSSDKAGSLNL